MGNFQDQKQAVLNVLEQTAKIAGNFGNKECASELREEAAHLRAGELNVDICGEAKRGKSSLINAFLEEQGLCPVDAPVATNAITTVQYAEKERILVHYQKAANGVMTTEEIQRHELKDFVTEQGNPKNARLVKLVNIWLDNPKLKDGLVLIDTPGVGSLNLEHTAVTYSIIPYADAVLFTGAADQPLTDPELDFAVRITKHTSRFLYVLTKRDRAENWEERLRDDLAKLEKAIGAPPGTIKGVAVSSSIKLEYVLDRDDEILAMSGFAELERSIWDLLGQRSAILLGRAQGRILAAISQLRFPLETEKRALEAKSATELKKLEEELQEKIDRADELTAGTPLWVLDLNTEIDKLRAQCTKGLENQFAALSQAVTDYLKIPEYAKNPDKLATMLTVDCNNAFAVTLANVETRMDEIVVGMRKSTSLNLDGGRATLDPLAPIEIAGDFERKRDSILKKASDVGRSSTLHTMGLGTAGGFAGAIVGGIIGTFAGPGGTIGGAIIGAKVGGTVLAFVGGIFGVKRGFSDMAERDLTWLKQNLAVEARRQLDTARRSLSHALSVLLTEVRSSIHQDMIRQIMREQKACRDAIEKLKPIKQKKQTDASQQIQSLTNALKMLDHLEACARTFGESSAETSAAA